MKRMLFYLLILFQIFAVLIVVVQYNLIDKYGVEKTFIVQPEEYEDEFYEGQEEEDNIYDYETYTFDLAINQIPKANWEVKKDYDYRTEVYVLLKENKSGIYEVVKATEEKITTDHEQEFILIGKNIYESEDDIFHVTYGFETINVKAHKEMFKDYKPANPAEVTYKFAPWNQSKLIRVE